MIIKPSRWGLVLAVAWIGFLCLLMVAGAASEHDWRGLWLVFVWLPWLVPVALAARSRLTAVGDTLTYRGPLRTRAWHQAQIGGFAVIPSSWSRGSRIYMHTTVGQWIAFPITATAWPRSSAQLRSRLSELQEWLENATLQPDSG